ncbi:MAG: LysR family transcriptional regulator [Polyangiaceae bacterium]
MLDQLRQLAVFVKVVEHGSFRAAGRALSLSPSVVSHHVAELEDKLALPLLYRSTRRVALTPDGERLLGYAREMVDAAGRGLDAVSGRSATPTGTLRVTAPAFLAETRLCGDLAAFSAAHPNVRLSFAFTEVPQDLLRDGFDLALRAGRLEDSTHKTRKLAEMHRVLVASPKYLHGKKGVRAPQDLEALDFVQLSPRPPQLTIQAMGAKKPVTVSLAPKIAADSAAAIRHLVLAGAGMGALPEVMVREDLSRGRLAEVLPGAELPVLGVHAVWPNNAQRASLTQRFIDFLAPRIEALFTPPGK